MRTYSKPETETTFICFFKYIDLIVVLDTPRYLAALDTVNHLPMEGIFVVSRTCSLDLYHL